MKDIVVSLKHQNSDVFNDDKAKCDILNTFFASVFTKEDVSVMPEVTQVSVGNISRELNEIEITPFILFIRYYVLNKILKLKNGKVPGDDGIIPEFLKEVTIEICMPLYMIYNFS